MTSPLGVAPAVLREQASRLDEFAEQRARHVQRVVEIASAFAGSWRGAAGSSVQKALDEYVRQATDTRREEQEIAAALTDAADRYTSTDTEGAAR